MTDTATSRERGQVLDVTTIVPVRSAREHLRKRFPEVHPSLGSQAPRSWTHTVPGSQRSFLVQKGRVDVGILAVAFDKLHRLLSGVSGTYSYETSGTAHVSGLYNCPHVMVTVDS